MLKASKRHGNELKIADLRQRAARMVVLLLRSATIYRQYCSLLQYKVGWLKRSSWHRQLKTRALLQSLHTGSNCLCSWDTFIEVIKSSKASSTITYDKLIEVVK